MILEDLRGFGALLCGGGQEVLRDLRELVFRVFLDGGLVVAEQALPLVFDVLAVGDDKEDAEDWPLECIAQVLEGAAGGLPAFVLPPREQQRGDHAECEKEDLHKAHAQGKGLFRGLVFARFLHNSRVYPPRG